MEKKLAFNTRVFFIDFYADFSGQRVVFFSSSDTVFAFGAIIAGIFYPLFLKIRDVAQNAQRMCRAYHLLFDFVVYRFAFYLPFHANFEGSGWAVFPD